MNLPSNSEMYETNLDVRIHDRMSLFRSQLDQRRFGDQTLGILKSILVSKDANSLLEIRSMLKECKAVIDSEDQERSVDEKLFVMDFFIRAFAVSGDVQNYLALKYDALLLLEKKFVNEGKFQLAFEGWLVFAEDSLKLGLYSIAVKGLEKALLQVQPNTAVHGQLTVQIIKLKDLAGVAHAHGTTAYATINNQVGVFVGVDGSAWDVDNKLVSRRAKKLFVTQGGIVIVGAGCSRKYRTIRNQLYVQYDPTFDIEKTAKYSHFMLKYGRAPSSDMELEHPDPDLEVPEVLENDECSLIFAGTEEGNYRLFVATRIEVKEITRIEVKEIFDLGINAGVFGGLFDAHYSYVNNFVAIGSGRNFATLHFLEHLSDNQLDMRAFIGEQHAILMLETMKDAMDKDDNTEGLATFAHVGDAIGIYGARDHRIGDTIGIYRVMDHRIPLALSRLRADLYDKMHEEACNARDFRNMELYEKVALMWENKHSRLFLEALDRCCNRAAQKVHEKYAAKARTRNHKRTMKRMKPFRHFRPY